MKTLIITLISLLATPLFARDLTCFTPRMAKKIVIKADSVAITKPYLKGISDRAVASSNSVRTKFTRLGFEKIIFSDGHKHTIRIKDKTNLSDINDYLIIQNNKGHEVVYPLDCE